MKSKLAVFVIIGGVITFLSYTMYDISEHGGGMIKHFFTGGNPFEIFIHILIVTVLFGSLFTGYLINERKKLLERTVSSEEMLRKALSEWRSTFDSLPYGAILTDGDYNILRANTFIAKLAGMPVKDLVGKKCFEIVHKKDAPINGCPMHKARMTGKSETIEYYDDDHNRTFNFTVLPVSGEDEGLTFYVHLIGDISVAKEQEKKLKQNRDAFFNMLKDINETHKELREVHNDLIVAFANIIDAKSQWTKGHSIGVTTYAVAIAEEMGLGRDEVELLRLASLLHDIGKIGTYDVILDKPSSLTEEEYLLVKQHPIKGSDILSPIKGFESLLPIIRAHHERYDGTGYPDGLKGEQIPLLARILCVADSYDSMISDRPYRTACSKEFAISEFRRCSGSQFDPDVINVFLKLLQT